MSCADELNALTLRAVAEKCAKAEAENEILRARLDVALRSVVALERVRITAVPAVSWRYDSVESPELRQAIRKGNIGHARVTHAVTDCEDAFRIDGPEQVRSKLLRHANTLIQCSVHRDERACVRIYQGNLILGCLDPQKDTP